MIYPESLEQRDSFINGSNQFQVRIIRIKHHASMRMKGKNNRLSMFIFSNLFQRRNDLLMPHMHPIKKAQSDGRAFKKIGPYFMKDFQAVL